MKDGLIYQSSIKHTVDCHKYIPSSEKCQLPEASLAKASPWGRCISIAFYRMIAVCLHLPKISIEKVQARGRRYIPWCFLTLRGDVRQVGPTPTCSRKKFMRAISGVRGSQYQTRFPAQGTSARKRSPITSGYKNKKGWSQLKNKQTNKKITGLPGGST